MKKSLMLLSVGTVLLGVSYYAFSSSNSSANSVKTTVISGVVKSVESAERTIQARGSVGRVTAISITALPCGNPGDPCGIAYIAAIETDK